MIAPLIQPAYCFYESQGLRLQYTDWGNEQRRRSYLSMAAAITAVVGMRPHGHCSRISMLWLQISVAMETLTGQKAAAMVYPTTCTI